MSISDRLNRFFNGPDDEEYEEEEMAMFNRSDRAEPEEDRASSSKKNKVVNINATTQLQVVLVKPEEFSEAPSIGDHLNNKRTVVLNLESTPKDIARRLVDFLSGVAYANHGTLKRVANSTFIITPYNVDIMGDMLIDELESNGLY